MATVNINTFEVNRSCAAALIHEIHTNKDKNQTSLVILVCKQNVLTPILIKFDALTVAVCNVLKQFR